MEDGQPFARTRRHVSAPIGMCDWTGCPGVNLELLPPKVNTQLLPLASSKQPPLPSRFDFASSEKLAELAKGNVPANTTKSTKWALKVFKLLWSEARNQRYPEEPVPRDLLNASEPVAINPLTYYSLTSTTVHVT